MDKSSPETAKVWDDFVARSPEGSVFSSTVYLNALKADYELLVLRVNNKIQAGMVLTKDSLKSNSNPLYCKYLGVMFGPIPGKRKSTIVKKQFKLTRPFIDYIKSLKSFDFNFHPNFFNWMEFYWAGFKQESRYTYVLPADQKDTWPANAEGNVRTEIKKAISENCSVKIVDDVALLDLETIYRLNMAPYLSRRQKPLMSADKFKAYITDLLNTNIALVATAYDAEGTPLSSGVLVFDSNSGYLVLNGTANGAPYFINRYMFSQLIEYTHNMGLDFDFEGSMIRSIEKFYRDFNPELVSYFKIWKPSLLRNLKSIGVSAAKKILGYDR